MYHSLLLFSLSITYCGVSHSSSSSFACKCSLQRALGLLQSLWLILHHQSWILTESSFCYLAAAPGHGDPAVMIPTALQCLWQLVRGRASSGGRRVQPKRGSVSFPCCWALKSSSGKRVRRHSVIISDTWRYVEGIPLSHCVVASTGWNQLFLTHIIPMPMCDRRWVRTNSPATGKGHGQLSTTLEHQQDFRWQPRSQASTWLFVVMWATDISTDPEWLQ